MTKSQKNTADENTLYLDQIELEQKVQKLIKIKDFRFLSNLPDTDLTELVSNLSLIRDETLSGALQELKTAALRVLDSRKVDSVYKTLQSVYEGSL